MTTDAIKRVKEAELKASSIIDSANKEAISLKKKSHKDCEKLFDDSLQEAKKKANNLMFSFKNEGEMLSKPIIEKAQQEVSLIESVDKSKLESVVNSIVERIVSANGDS